MEFHPFLPWPGVCGCVLLLFALAPNAILYGMSSLLPWPVTTVSVPRSMQWGTESEFEGYEENHEIIRLDFGSAHLYKCTVQLFKWLDEWHNPGSIIGSSTRRVRQARKFAAGLFLTEHKNLLEITKI
jgi:hypothetical protein